MRIVRQVETMMMDIPFEKFEEDKTPEGDGGQKRATVAEKAKEEEKEPGASQMELPALIAKEAKRGKIQGQEQQEMQDIYQPGNRDCNNKNNNSPRPQEQELSNVSNEVQVAIEIGDEDDDDGSWNKLTQEELRQANQSSFHVIRWMQQRFGLLKEVASGDCPLCGTTLDIGFPYEERDGASIRCSQEKCQFTDTVMKRSRLSQFIKINENDNISFASWIQLFLSWRESIARRMQSKLPKMHKSLTPLASMKQTFWLKSKIKRNSQRALFRGLVSKYMIVKLQETPSPFFRDEDKNTKTQCKQVFEIDIFPIRRDMLLASRMKPAKIDDERWNTERSPFRSPLPQLFVIHRRKSYLKSLEHSRKQAGKTLAMVVHENCESHELFALLKKFIPDLSQPHIVLLWRKFSLYPVAAFVKQSQNQEKQYRDSNPTVIPEPTSNASGFLARIETYFNNRKRRNLPRFYDLKTYQRQLAIMLFHELDKSNTLFFTSVMYLMEKHLEASLRTGSFENCSLSPSVSVNPDQLKRTSTYQETPFRLASSSPQRHKAKQKRKRTRTQTIRSKARTRTRTKIISQTQVEKDQDINSPESTENPLLYVVETRETRMYKIGMTKNLKQRMQKMQTDNGCEITRVLQYSLFYPETFSVELRREICYDLEQSVHCYIENSPSQQVPLRLRKRTEWFRFPNLDRKDVIIFLKGAIESVLECSKLKMNCFSVWDGF